MTARPSLSVVVPYWNGHRTIERALRSVATASTGWDISVTVVDDGSRPESSAALRSLLERFDRTECIHVDNGGVAAARNLGVASSTSPLVAFLDQDDEWLPGKLEAQWEVLRPESGLAYVTGRTELRVEEGYARPGWCRPEWLEAPQPGLVLGAVLAWREAIEGVGPFDPTLQHGGDDTDWFARARRRGTPTEMVASTVLRRWIHGENQLHDRRGTGDLLAVVRRHASERSASKR